MKIASIVGARPQFVKAAVVSRALRSAGATEVLIHTAQHYDEDMSQVFFDELQIPYPDYDLGIGSGSHGCQTGRMLQAIEEVLLRDKPDWTLVYGDTNSTLAGSLAAAKLQMPIAHVEAGLRSFNRQMPEEINRVVTDHVAELLFAPTDVAVQNLRSEGIPEQKIRLVGDVMYDAALIYGEQASQRTGVLDRLSLQPKQYLLATIHRAENTDEVRRLREIISALRDLARDLPVVLPVHPRTRKVLVQMPGLNDTGGVLRGINPVGYLEMVALEKNAALIVTDSGGVQKEAFFYGVGCVTLRDQTEWTELVELGWNRVVPPVSSAAIIKGIREALAAPAGKQAQPYGNGNSSQIIAQMLCSTDTKLRNSLM